MYVSTKIARVVSNHAPVGTHSLYQCSGFSLVCTCLHFLRRFALVLHFFALVSLSIPKLAPVKEYETTEVDFCSNPKKHARKQLWREKRYNVSICVSNQGGGIFFCYDAPGLLAGVGFTGLTCPARIRHSPWPCLVASSAAGMKYRPVYGLADSFAMLEFGFSYNHRIAPGKTTNETSRDGGGGGGRRPAMRGVLGFSESWQLGLTDNTCLCTHDRELI